MSIYRLAKPLRQALAVALLLLAVALFAGLAVVPLYAKVTGLQEQIEQERTTLARLNAFTRDEDKAREFDRRTSAARARGLFLDGESEAIRLANLQSRLTEIAAASGVKLRSMRNLPPRERSELRMLGVQLHFAAPIERLRKILLNIEEQRTVLLIEALHISPLTGSWTASDEQRGNLDVQFDVFGIEARQK